MSTLLATAGYSRDEVPDESVLLAIRWAFAGLPLICFTLGIAVFTRFGLDSRTHAEIRAKIDARGRVA